MVQFTLTSALVLATSAFVSAQDIAAMPGCGQTCLGGLEAKSAEWNCPADKQGFACYCPQQDFQNGMHDCVKSSCPAEADQKLVFDLFDTACRVATAGATSASTPATTPPATTSTPAPASTTETSSSDIINPSTTPASTTTTEATSSAAPSTTESATASATTSTTSETSSSASDTASTSASTAAASTTSGPAASSSAPASAPSKGLSTEAKIGTAVGAGVGLVAILALFVCCFVSRRKLRARQLAQHTPGSPISRLKISEPMPGAGRTYADDRYHEQYKLNEDLEATSRRYEDMVPRHVPRNMV